MGTAIQLNGSIVWGFVVEVGRGLRLRLSVNDWERQRLNLGQRIRVRIPKRFDESVIVAEMVEVPPAVWIMLTHRVCDVRTTPVILPCQIRKQVTAATHQSSSLHELPTGEYIVSIPRVVERLHSLVLRDQRYSKLGIGGLARIAFQEVAGRIPSADEIHEAIQDFWEYWHGKYDKVQRRFVIRDGWRRGIEEELSPSQENAIRVLEDADL